MGLRLRSRLGNFGKISRDFGKYSSRPGFSVYNLGKITEIWSRLIFFVYCSLNLNTVIVLLPRKQREKRTRSRISRSRRDLQWTEMDMSVPIPDVDRGRADFRSIKAVVIEATDSGNYKLGTEHGELSQMYVRSQFAPSVEKFINVSDVPSRTVSLREAARSSSIGLGQGFFKCTCTTGCNNKRCKCKKADKICNSRCHNSNSCKNK